jgi:hypothetical protein
MTKFLIIFAFTLFYTSLNPVLADGFGVEIVDQKEVTITGIIQDEPSLVTIPNGDTESYSFRIAAGDGSRGNEWMSVSYFTKLANYRVGKFNFKKGDKITISGKATKASANDIGYLGKITINVHYGEELKRFPKEN